jgi:diguanylate cyclase (GGDEF)-like protein/PAS domain S-box-containing protein
LLTDIVMGLRRPAAKAAAAETAPARTDDNQFAEALATLDSRRRDALLEAMASAARELLTSTDLRATLPKVAERIGVATGVDRVHVFVVDGGDAGEIVQHCLWVVPGVATPDEFRKPTMPMSEAGLASWIPRLARGEAIAGHTRDFEPAVRALFEKASVKSALSVPIFADSRWRGIIGFDDCLAERDWSAAEIDTIKIVAELIGAAIARAAHSQSLADAARIVERSPTILYRLSPDPHFNLTYVSENVRRYGYTPQELLAEPGRWLTLVAPEDMPNVMASFSKLIEGKTDHVRLDFRIKKADGSVVWFDSEGNALRSEAGKLTGVEGILNDVTERKNAEGKLSFSHILLSTAIESSPDAILVVNEHGRIIMFNRHFIELWEIPRELVDAGIDEPVLATVASRVKDKEGFLTRVRYLYDHPEEPSHEEIETADERIVDRYSASLYDAQRHYLGRVWFFRDITEQKRAGERIAAMARTDSLTGLPNRAAFLDRLGLEFARARRSRTHFAVLYLDLDHFKDINDTLGHPTGDQLLRAVSERLKKCVRETDMVARFGGDEFAVLQVDVDDDADSVEALAGKIGDVVARPFAIGGNRVTTSVSIGVVPYRNDIAGTDAMMMKADLALYRAKNEGRNQYRFHVAALDEETRERVTITEDLRHAVERNELELHYQPQVALETGTIIGLEALIRWNHPTRGLMLPAAFIPIAETSGSIVPIGEWVIDQACRQVMAWNAQGIAPQTVAVNLSGAQLKLASQLDKIVAECLEACHLRPEQLELELTESVLIETAQRHSDAFRRLQRLGIRLAIDDFGTGYSSLDYLRSFRVSRLKIDRSFVDGVTSNPDDAVIVRATIGLAHALGIEVIAEGVETAAQCKFLLAAGCRAAQGFYFGAPMPVAAVTALLFRQLQLAAG